MCFVTHRLRWLLRYDWYKDGQFLLLSGVRSAALILPRYNSATRKDREETAERNTGELLPTEIYIFDIQGSFAEEKVSDLFLTLQLIFFKHDGPADGPR